MSVLDWLPQKRLLVELRKALRGAQNAEDQIGFVTLSPTCLDGLPLRPKESVLAEVTNRNGRRFYFGSEALFIEVQGQWVRLAYDAIVAYHWIAETKDLREKLPLMSKHGDRIVLVDNAAVRYELDGLGLAFQGLHNFFTWLIARRTNAPLQSTSDGDDWAS
jgi:hypothetical protein